MDKIIIYKRKIDGRLRYVGEEYLLSELKYYTTHDYELRTSKGERINAKTIEELSKRNGAYRKSIFKVQAIQEVG